MVQFPDKVKKIIDIYLKTLSQNNIPIKEAVLFGSYASGNYGEWSDIDIAIVSDIFKGNQIDDKGKIRKVTLSVSSEIEEIPFSLEDFNRENPYAKEILRTGIKLM